jgi:hypothetical protein
MFQFRRYDLSVSAIGSSRLQLDLDIVVEETYEPFQYPQSDRLAFNAHGLDPYAGEISFSIRNRIVLPSTA